jgi:hypothetical protein
VVWEAQQMMWRGKLSHGRQVAVAVPVVCALGVVAFHGLGDGWGRAVVEGIAISLAALVLALVIGRQRQGSEKYED